MPPQIWVQSATLAIFGEGGDAVITEQTPISGVGPPQMVQVALAWERAYRRAVTHVDRSVLLRIGVTIGGADDPATERLAQLARLGLGGAVGTGRQWMSWVTLDDVLSVFLRALDDPATEGTYHLTSPSPERNADMMAAVRAVVGRRIGLPAPGWLTRLGAPILGSDPELALTGRRCVPARLIEEGYVFNQTDLRTALRETITANAAS